MCRTFPVRTGLFTVGPVAIGLAQLLNATLNGAAVWVAVLATAVMCAFSVLVTGYHLAQFRRHTLTREFDLGGSL